MSFLAQFDSGDVRRAGFDAPFDGVISFFYDRSVIAGPGDPEPVRVYEWPRDGLQRLAAPDGSEVLRECAVELVTQPTLPDAHTAQPWTAEILGGDAREAYLDFMSLPVENLGLVGTHQLFGWPRSYATEVHWAAAGREPTRDWWTARRGGDIATLHTLAEEARGYACLAQFDEDDNADLQWVDAGTCTVMTRRGVPWPEALGRAVSVLYFC